MPTARLFCALLLATPLAVGAQQIQIASTRSDATCSSDADDVRRAALVGIMQIEPMQILPVLEKLLERRDECSVALRRQVVDMLPRTKEPARIDVLLRVARTDPSVSVRRQAVQALGQVNDERSAAALDSIFFASMESDLADPALRALSQQSRASGRASLRRVAERTSIPIELRVRAVNYLGSGRRGAEEVQFLRDMFARTSGPQLRDAIIRAVASQRTADGTTWLLAIARDRNQEIELRRVALRSAAQALPTSDFARTGEGGMAMKDVLALYDEFARQPDMQDQLLDVLAQRPESAATDKLMQIAKEESSIELRKKAVQRLGQRRDPRVRQFLLDIVSQ